MSANKNSSAPTTAQVIGGQFNVTPPAPVDGQALPLQQDSAGNLLVNIASGGGTGGTASTFGAAFPGTGTAAGAEFSSSPPTLTSGTMAALQVDINGNLKVTQTPSISGGDSVFHLAAAGTTNATNIKASQGKVYGWAITNTNTSARYICFHNTAGTPTAGVSVYMKFGIPGGGAANVSFFNGIGGFTSGIAITTVVNPADSDATAVAVNDLIINIFYD